MSRFILSFTQIVAALALASCQSPMAQTAQLDRDYLETDPTSKDAIRGVPYFLPSTVLPVTIAGDFQPVPTADDKEKKDPKFQEFVIGVTIGQPKQVPDSSAQFVLEYLPEGASADEFRIAVGDNGLLETVKLTSVDQSGEIAKKLVELAKEAAKAVIQFGTGGVSGFRSLDEENANRLACRELVQKFSVTKNLRLSEQLRYDVVVGAISDLSKKKPEDLSETEKLTLNTYKEYVASFGSDSSPIKQDLAQMAAAVNLGIATANANPVTGDIFKITEMTGLESTNLTGVASYTALVDPLSYATLQEGLRPTGRDTGVVFRAAKPVSLAFTLDTKDLKVSNAKSKVACTVLGTSVATEPLTVLAQHPFQTYVADTGRGFLVKKRVDLTVTNGVLTGTEVDKPSEVLAGVTLPVEILKTIVSIPAELLTVKLKLLQDEGSLTTAQANLIKAQIDLLKQQEELKKQQAID